MPLQTASGHEQGFEFLIDHDCDDTDDGDDTNDDDDTDDDDGDGGNDLCRPDKAPDKVISKRRKNGLVMSKKGG